MKIVMKLDSNHKFFKTIEKLSSLFSERAFVLNEEGMQTAGMNNSNTVFGFVDLPASEFDEYSFKPQESDDEEEGEIQDKKSFMIDLNYIVKAVKGYKGEVTMIYEEPKLTIKCKKTTVIICSEMDSQVSIPEVPYLLDSDISQSEFHEIVKDCKDFEGITLEATKDKLKIEGSNRVLNIQQELDSNHDLKDKELIQARYSPEYMRYITDLPFEFLNIKFDEGMPIQVTGKDNKFLVYLLLADRGEE